ncbi:GtrA family protein [Petropleomorpha daqingensis]|uniref:Putative flippase GtrA n=1 Tax=Petropleomorpha daqingensis TaxID=2026353 RepID=A0A853CD84_9ACTN|nr:GtrA family protein [Petropleomorpha daqingensis]NYJ05026.1 putative flippase GtrA [Petropleomorpha daqingensis]
MTCALLRRPEAADVPTSEQVRSSGSRLAERLRADDAGAQFTRFVLVGGVSSLLYALLYVLLDGFGDQPANVAGAVASSMLANELHRRLTFHAGERVSWFAAQWEGGGLALVGMVATALALGWFDSFAGDDGSLADLAVVAVVTGAIGLIRFAALRWVFGARTPDHA